MRLRRATHRAAVQACFKRFFELLLGQSLAGVTGQQGLARKRQKLLGVLIQKICKGWTLLHQRLHGQHG